MGTVLKRKTASTALAGRIEFPTFSDDRGSLSFLEGENHIPFNIKRIYYVYDIPPLARRGGHAHRELNQVIIAIAGSFDLHLDRGMVKERIRLDSPGKGVHIRPMTWIRISNYSPDAVCLVLASAPFDESEYIRDYSRFLIELN